MKNPMITIAALVMLATPAMAETKPINVGVFNSDGSFQGGQTSRRNVIGGGDSDVVASNFQ